MYPYTGTYGELIPLLINYALLSLKKPSVQQLAIYIQKIVTEEKPNMEKAQD